MPGCCSLQNSIIDDIPAPQLRAARALLAWSQERLAEVCGIPKRTIARIELGGVAPQQRTVVAIRTALEAAGVQFIEQNGGGPGVRLRHPGEEA